MLRQRVPLPTAQVMNMATLQCHLLSPSLNDCCLRFPKNNFSKYIYINIYDTKLTSLDRYFNLFFTNLFRGTNVARIFYKLVSRTPTTAVNKKRREYHKGVHYRAATVASNSKPPRCSRMHVGSSFSEPAEVLITLPHTYTWEWINIHNPKKKKSSKILNYKAHIQSNPVHSLKIQYPTI
jgi:hypothetical protein